MVSLDWREEQALTEAIYLSHVPYLQMNKKIPSQPLSRQAQEQWQQPLGSTSLCFARSTNQWKFQKAPTKSRSQRQKSTCRNHSPYNLSCPSFPFKFDDLAVLELFREESRLTLPAPAVQSSAQSVPYSWLYYHNNVATVHLHLLRRSLTIPQRDTALRTEWAWGIINGGLWVTQFKKR